MRRRLGGRVAAALLLALAVLPVRARAQYVEPYARRPGVVMPIRVPASMAAEAARLGFPPPGRVPRPFAVARTGTRGMVVIPALFADSPEPFVSAEDIQASLFDGPSPRGTVGDFYSNQSGGVFTIDGHVLPWVRTSVSLVGAAGTDGTFGDSLDVYVRQAVMLADATVDFGLYDNDGPDGVPNSGDDDGTVDGVSIQYLEVAGSCGGPGVWPHLSGISDENGNPFQTNDLRPNGSHIVIQVYIADSAVNCSGVGVQGPEVMAHEIGHLLGLPDYYRQAEGIQPWQRHWAVGCFDVMGAGSWGCGAGDPPRDFGPTGFSALSRVTLGWATFEHVGDVTDQEYTLEPLNQSQRALEIPLTQDGTESFIVEYRPQTGYDAALPAGGVLVYDRDLAPGGDRWVPPGLPPAYGYNLVEADGDDALLKVEAEGGNRGVASDVFARGGAVDSITDATVPSTRDHLGRPTTVRLRDISVVDGVAHLRISTAQGFAVIRREAPSALEGGRPYSTTSTVGGATLPLHVDVAPGTTFPDGFRFSVNGSVITVSGTWVDAGPFHASLIVDDAAGHELVEHVAALVRDPIIDPHDLASAVAGATSAVTDTEAIWLDSAGNANGGLDVGDLRASLLRRGVLYQPAR